MLIEILLGILAGTIFGIISGLTPGIHVNLISVSLISLSAILLSVFSSEMLVCFIVAMAITHTFLDTIPSIFLGAPDGATALSVLPGHRMLLEGHGSQAVKLTVIGSLFGLLITLFTYPILEFIIGFIYPLIKEYIGHLLVIVGAFIINSSNNKFLGLLVFSFSGILGYIVLESRQINPLFPLLSGFFGIATLLYSLKDNNNLPKQNKSKIIPITFRNTTISGLQGSFSGFLTAFLPGLGASTAAAIGSLLRKDSDTKNFLVMIGAISTVNFFMSIAALNAIGKARNGAIIAVMNLIPEPSTLLLISSAVIAGGVAVLLAFRISDLFSVFIQKINYQITVKIIVLLILLLTFFLTGVSGIIILTVSTLIGLYANMKGVTKNTMMACILVPVAVFFLG